MIWTSIPGIFVHAIDVRKKCKEKIEKKIRHNHAPRQPLRAGPLADRSATYMPRRPNAPLVLTKRPVLVRLPACYNNLLGNEWQ